MKDDEQTMKEDPAAKDSSPDVFTEPHETMGTLQSKPQLGKQTIPRQTNGGVTSLSFGQQRLWFLQQLDPTSPVYNTYRAWRVRGALNVEVLRNTLQTVIARHGVLRAVIQVVNGKACQVTQDTSTFELPVEDLRECSSEGLEIVATERTHQEAKTPFDLSRGPLFRAKLLRLDDEDHVLLISMHHIITDGWSYGVLHREISVLYQAFESGGSSPLPALPLQYGDYALRQHDFIQGTRLEKLRTYWSRQLSHLTPLQLPTDRIRPSMTTFRGGRQGFSIGNALTAKLKGWSQQEGATLFTTLLTCFKVLLFRYSGQADIAVGAAKHSRMYKEVEPLIGMFVNTLVLRSDLSDNPSFRELVQHVRDTCLAAYAHQEMPFDKLVDVLQPERDMSRNPLFQAAITFQNTPDQLLELPGLEVSPFESSSIGTLWNDTSKFDLTLTLLESDGEIKGMMEYSTDLFDSTTIRRMIGHLQTLIEGVGADPDQRIGELPLLRENERREMMAMGCGAKSEYPKDQCIQQLFERQVAQRPQAVAVVLESQRVTYRELNTRANQLAHYLQRRGVGPEILVGLCMERSLEMVVGLLGILKAGGAYVPLDPTYPQERLAFMGKDADLRVILTQKKFQDHLSHLGAEHIRLDADWPVIGQEEESTPVSEARADSLAYVIYTSGSTGRPKGVQVTHANVVRLFLATEAWYHFNEKDVWTLFHSYAFDFSVWELWGAFFYGGRVVIVPYELSRSPEEFYKLLVKEQVTILNQTPSAFRQLIRAEDTLGPSPQLALRYIIFGGEALDLQSLKPWFDRHVDQMPQLVNMYGITETTVHVTYQPLTSEHLTSGSVIGRPLPDLQVYILDRNLEPVPIGVPGELYVGGAGVARGYLNRPDLTAERFIAHLFSETSQVRLYKTGDRGRFLSDGVIEYLGRMDNQVQLRGFRIELGEIEALLAQHPMVAGAVAVVREDGPEDKRLVAYVVPHEPSTPSPSELREFLQEKLPSYMVPSSLTLLEALPLTPNGKVDRRALPEPDGRQASLSNKFVPPRSPVEEDLVDIWGDLLRLEQVGVHDNFFDLGGHSLLATQVISRVRDLFHIEVPLRHLFEGPTIDSLAKVIENTRRAGQTLTAQPLVPCSRATTLPLSFAQQRLWFLHQLEPESPAYNSPLALRLQGPLDVVALRQGLQTLVDRHETLRTCFPDVEGRPSQVIADSMVLPWDQQDLRAVPAADREEVVQELIQSLARQPFNLATGPVIRTSLLQGADADFVLLITLHHIISDGWSLGVVSRELAALYDAVVHHQPSPLPPLPIQYVDFAHWQREWFTGEVLEQQLTYWRQHLTDLAPLELPTDRPRPPVQTYAGASHSFNLVPSLKDALHQLSRQAGVTVAITLLAAFQVLLARYTGQSDLAVGLPIANRNRREIEGLIGFFVNSLVMRTDLSGDPTFHDALKRVQQVSLAAYDHQDLPFEQLVEELQPERDPSRNPLFQVIFAVQNAPAEAFTLPGVTVQPFGRETTTTRFDLEGHIWERDKGLQVAFVYNTNLFDPSTIERFSQHFQQVLEEVVRDPGQRLSQIPLLSYDEHHQLLVEWNATQTAYPRAATIAERFEAQVAATPDAVAVVFDEQQLTYFELNTRANHLAQYLSQQHGVGPEVCVGLCLERSVEMVVGLLGILKAGGAYVPLDPGTPAERLVFMLKDADIALVLTQDALKADLPGDWAGPVIALDTEWARIAQMPATNVASGVTADNLAYIMYTSGSTGVPKGTSICQRSVVRLVTNTNYLDFGAAETLLQFAPLAFDASTLELWGSLLHGARLVIFSPHQPSLEELGHCLQEHEISTLWLTAALFHQMAGSQPEALRGVRQLLAGGDVLSVPHVQRVVANLPEGGRLINGYGPTENTTFTCCHVMTGESRVETTGVPIGRPIANTQVYVLDRTLQPVPVGVYGELYIGGDGLARNYLQRPGLTAERFVPHPFSSEPGARLYKTGDVVRYRSDGTLEFKGRRDHQVKVRGYRIELGEIEAVVTQHPAIAESVALVREDAPGDKRVVSYIVPDAEQTQALIQAEGNEWASQHILEWQTLYEQTYGDGVASADPTFNITGWQSSYTGEAIPAVEMQEWVEATVARVQALEPQRVWEIGCGTGLLLYRLAPQCREYLGTDFSHVALQTLRQGLADRTDLAHVVLEHRVATDFTGIAAGSVDTVIINSVTQYLPSMDYLAQVLEGAVQAVKPGGQIVVGDVRSLPLLTAYHASIQLHQATGTLSTEELAQQIQQARAREEELVIDPAFFAAFAQQVPRIGQVEVLLKQGQAHNELTRFRFDVILNIEPPEEVEESIQWRDWIKEEWSVARLQAWLQAEGPSAVGFTGIPNARLQREVQTLAWLTQQTGPDTVGELRETLDAMPTEAVDPQAFWAAVSQFPYWCELGSAGTGADGTMSAVLRRRTSERRPCLLLPYPPSYQPSEVVWGRYGTNPLKAKLVKTLIPQVRTYLEEHVPDYMIPSAFVTLDSLPLTPNGKVDRKALPAPLGTRASLETSYVAPRTPMEQQLVDIWQEVLGLEQVGVQDNFFELGGHSLLATQVVSRVRDTLHIDLKLQHFFELPSIAGLAGTLEILHTSTESHQGFRKSTKEKRSEILL